MPEQESDRTFTARMHPHLYEINTWAWLEEQSRRARKPVTLGAVPDQEWDGLHGLGFDLVWLMGIWKRSAAGRRIFRTDINSFTWYDAALPGWAVTDVVGSPYSIQDYAPDPRIGTWSEIDAVRRKIHDRNMSLILDFVPNHTGPDHPWIQAQPDYYIQGTLADFRRNPSAFFLAETDRGPLFIARGKDPFSPPWPDSAQLNYFNPATRAALLTVLKTISVHCDGVRCDMAMLCLNDVFAKTWGRLTGNFKAPDTEFWPSTIAVFPGFIWIAEVYWDLEQRMQQAGFNFTYDKGLYDCLRGGSPRDVRQCLNSDLNYQDRTARFLENHDEARAISAFGKERLPAVATIAATLPGLRFYHDGQLRGKKLHLPIQLDRAPEEADDPEVAKLYARLLQLSGAGIFHQKDWKLLEARAAGDASNQNLIAYQWRSGGDVALIVVNLGASSSQGRVYLDPPVDSSRQHLFSDVLNDRNYQRDGRDLAVNGLFVRLEGYRAHIFKVSIRG